VRIGFISDVHANLIALESVLDDMDGQGVDQIYNSGDLVGYYPYPLETIALLKSKKIMSIQGNHDRSVLSADTNHMNPWARSAVSWTAMQLNDSARKYLQQLPTSLNFHIGRIRCSMHHGAPGNPDHYVYPEEAGQELLDRCEAQLLVLGHTHVPFVKRFERGTILNPGSVGQPRDGDPRASYLIFDPSSNEFQHFRVAYDIERVQNAVIDAGLPSSLADRLAEGW
jgi:putative phosphoesterase